MSQQKPVELNDLMDHEAPPTIISTKLTPELSEAALNLTIDFQRQKQSTANTAILRHPYTVFFIVTLFSGIAYWKCGWTFQRGGFALVKENMDEVAGAVVIAMMFTSVILTMATRPTDVLRTRADSIVDNSSAVFGFDLKEYAGINAKGKLSKDHKVLLEKAENTRVIIYRDTPIAVTSLVEVPEMSSKEKFVTKITSAGIRKVYWKSGLIEDLIDWTIKRSGELNNSQAPKILVLFEVLSTDYELKKVLASKKFQKIETLPVNDSVFLKIFGVKYEIYGIGLSVSKLSDIEGVKSKTGSTGAKRRA
jgi:hypothetical protein